MRQYFTFCNRFCTGENLLEIIHFAHCKTHCTLNRTLNGTLGMSLIVHSTHIQEYLNPKKNHTMYVCPTSKRLLCPAPQMILKKLVWEGRQVGLELAHNSTTSNRFLPLTLGDRLAPILDLSHPELMSVFGLLSPPPRETTVKDVRQGKQGSLSPLAWGNDSGQCRNQRCSVTYRKAIGKSDNSGWRRMSMTFRDNASERRERGRIKSRGHRTSALIYGECLYDAIRVGDNFFFLI
jgi:hypothetical protein